MRRFTAGWHDWPWGSFFAEVRDWDADTGAYVTVGNPAHILVQCLTDPHWGLGYSQSALTTSFVVARYTLWAEGFGLNLVWTRQQPIESFIAQVLDHIGGVLYLNTWRGAYELKLLRDDYWIDGLPRLGPDEIVRMDRLERAVEGTAQRDHRGLHRLGHGQESDTLETALACVGGAGQLNWKIVTGASASALDTVAEEDYAPLLRLN